MPCSVMSLAELRRDKPREYEALITSGKLEQFLAASYPPVVVLTSRAFGRTALEVGFGFLM